MSFNDDMQWFYEWLERIKAIDPAIYQMIKQDGSAIAVAIAGGQIDRDYLTAVENSLRNGDYSILVGKGNAGMEKYVDNKMSESHTQQDQAYQTEMRDTSITSTGNQLQSLGLSPSSVVQVGGASSGVSSAAALTNTHSAYNTMAQLRMDKFKTNMGLAKSLIGAASSMASSGIYGSALGAIKNAGAKIATEAAHSGLSALKAANSPSPKISKKDVDDFWNNSFLQNGSI